MSIQTLIIYTKEDLKKLNKYTLRTLPQNDKYINLSKFISDENRHNLSNVIKRPLIPSYLKDKYGESNQKTSNNLIARGNYKDPRDSRRKICVNKAITPVDKVNEEVREILSKLSDQNKNKLLQDFQKCNIGDECGQTLIDYIYTFAVDLDYLIHIYVELIFLLKKKNYNLYGQLLQKIIENAYDPLIFEEDNQSNSKSKRWRLANIKLISELYCQNGEEINTECIQNLIDHLLKQMNPTQPEHLEVLCELLKNVMPILIKNNAEYVEQLVSQLEPLEQSKDYELRYRFLIQDVIEIYNYDSEDD